MLVAWLLYSAHIHRWIAAPPRRMTRSHATSSISANTGNTDPTGPRVLATRSSSVTQFVWVVVLDHEVYGFFCLGVFAGGRVGCLSGWPGCQLGIGTHLVIEHCAS
jgi:hypothetical protein